METKLTVAARVFGKNMELSVHIDRYKHENQPVINLTSVDGEPYFTASTCLSDPGVVLPKDCVWVKDYGENEGITGVLIKAGLIHPEMMACASNGYVTVKAYMMTDKLLDEFAKLP